MHFVTKVTRGESAIGLKLTYIKRLAHAGSFARTDGAVCFVRLLPQRAAKAVQKMQGEAL